MDSFPDLIKLCKLEKLQVGPLPIDVLPGKVCYITHEADHIAKIVTHAKNVRHRSLE